jgi:hypothetical protein
MKRISLILALIVGSLLTACVAVPVGERDYRSDRVMVAPFLPPVVVLDVEPYYFYSDFHYHYKNNRWYYSKSRRGPWIDLPRDRYPKEVRFKRQDREHDRDRSRDNRRY